MSTPLIPVLCVLCAFVGIVVCNTKHRSSAEDDPGGPTVSLATGIVRGFRYILRHLSSVQGVAFLGIPFAKPPVGALRFLYPEPVDPWSGILNATTLPNSCYQAPDLFFGPHFYGSNMWNPNTPMSEDCLYVNVWVPVAKASGKWKPGLGRLPVMVWIYGGGFYSGTSTLDVYDGQILASVNRVIVVSVAYRVGALGFLCLNDPSAPCNVGMFDQLLALDWVQRNIRRFGGDPDNVTLFGESAGAVSVSLHLLSPLSHSKYQRAILQSGTANMPWATLTMDQAKHRSLELAVQYLGCEDTGDMEAIAECLRLFPPQKLAEEQFITRGPLQFPFLPVVDGAFLVESPEETLRRKNFKRCPILIGSNLNEGSWFVIYEVQDYLGLNKMTMNREQFLTSINRLFYFYPQYNKTINTLALEAIRFQYSNWLDPEDSHINVQALDAAVGDSQFICPLNQFAQTYALARENVYMYFFTQRYSTNPWPKWMGVLHGDDIMFMFGEALKPGQNFTQDDKDLSRAMMTYWTNFAKTGDPNQVPGQRRVNDWPLYTPTAREYLELNARFLKEADKSLAVGRGPRIRECAFWNEYLPQLITAGERCTKEKLPKNVPPTVQFNSAALVSRHLLPTFWWSYLVYIRIVYQVIL